MRFPRFVSLFVCITLNTFSLFAQSPNGNINGLVSDPSSAAVVGAEVVAVNDVTGVQYTTKSNREGIYVLPNLPPGPYRLQVSKIGFKTLIKPDIVLNVQDSLSINFTLLVGAFHEIVTVQGGAPLVNTETAAVSTVVDRNFIENLPLNGRSFNTLLQLTPGVVIAPQPSSGNPGQFSIAGQRTSANNFMVDGVSANFGVSASVQPGDSGTGQAQAFSALGATSSLVSVDALQEFRVETSSFAPEFGRSPGGQVILTTRSGTNEFHGGVFEYFRNTAMDANDWFANNAGEPRAPEHHNDFGGFLGGPILKSKTFFFLSYEGARLDLPETSSIQVPSLYSRTQASASVRPFLDAYPQPNGAPASATAYVAPFTGDFANRATLNAGSVRIDHNFTDRFSIFGRYNDAPSQSNKRAYVSSEVDSASADVQTLTVGVNMLLSNRLSNVVHANFSQQDSDLGSVLDSFGGAVPPSPGVFFGSFSGSGAMAGTFLTFDTGAFQFGAPARNRSRQVNVLDDLLIAIGRHQIKVGGDYRALFLDVVLSRNHFTYQSPSVQALVTTGVVPELVVGISAPGQFLTNALSLYGQDTFQVTPRLTLTYGLRWELNPAPSPRGNTTVASWTNVGTPANIALAPPGTPLWKTTYGNFAPRFGIAYGLTAARDVVLRAGAGIFYDLNTSSVANLPLLFPGTATRNSFGVPLPLGDPTPYLPVVSLQPPYPFVAASASDLKLPRSYQWNIALEKSFAGKQALSLTYVGQTGRDLLRQEALYQPNSNFSSEFLLTQNDARSNYDALQIQYRRPLSSSLQALLNYSWAHSLDNASNDVVAGLSNTVISAENDYASSDFDVRHSFSAALSYDVPALAKSGVLAGLTGNWSVQSVIVARTGFPYNGVVVLASPDPGGEAQSRPDLVPGQPLYLYGAQCISVLSPPCAGGMGMNPAAFSVPSTPRQGTEGRNDIRGFGLTQVDVSLSKKIDISERLHLQFRADAFNVLNHPNFTNPQGFVEFGSFYLQSQEMLNQGLGGIGGLNPLFQEGGPRSLQLSLKMTF
jgi:hypothetical protein